MNSLKKIIILALWTITLFWLPVGLSFSQTETFYVCEGGDGTLPETATCATAFDDTDLQIAGNWESGVDSNDGKIGANDEVQFMDEGGDMRYRIWIHGSGSSGKPITFKNYPGDTPVINTSQVLSSWTAEDEVFLDEATTATQVPIFQSDARTYFGQGDYDPGASYTVSAMELVVQTEVGTFDQNVVAEIFNVSGSDLGTQPTGDCTSDAEYVDSTGTYKFEGMSCQISNGNDYSLVFRRSDTSYDASNYPFVYYDNAGDSWDGQMQGWNGDQTNSGKFATYEMGIKLYEKTGLFYSSYGAVAEPNQVFQSDSILTEESVKANLGSGEWYNDTGNDYCFMSSDPSATTVEASYWSMCIHTQNKSYLVFDGLTLEKSNAHNLWIDTASGEFNNITVQNCNINRAWNHGIGAGLGGFATSGEGVSNGLYIYNNTMDGNGIGVIADGTGTGFAIDIAGNSPTDYIDNVIVSGNKVTGAGAGIKSDWFGYGTVYEYNYVNTDDTCYSCDGCQEVVWRYNICDSTDSDVGWGISLFRWEGVPGPPYGFALEDNLIYGNVIYNNENGINLQDDHDGTKVKNNIFHGDFASNTPIQLEGGETLTDVEIDYNLYYTGANTPVFNESGVSTYNFTEWQAEGWDTNSPAMADPLFTDAGSDDFTLQLASPAINNGEDLGDSQDDVLDPTTTWPGGIATKDNDPYWEIGAYWGLKMTTHRHHYLRR